MSDLTYHNYKGYGEKAVKSHYYSQAVEWAIPYTVLVKVCRSQKPVTSGNLQIHKKVAGIPTLSNSIRK